MNKNVIARIKLTAGQIGYFDDLTQIYLTRQNPVADVLAGMNCTTLVNAVRAGQICVIEGSITQNSKVKKLFKLPQITVSAENNIEDKQQVHIEKKKEAATEEAIQVDNEVEQAVEAKEDFDNTEVEKAEEPKTTLVRLTAKGETYTLTEFENASFTSSDASVATVTKKGGKITAKANGKTTVIVSTSDGDTSIDVVVEIPEDSAEEVKEEQ